MAKKLCSPTRRRNGARCRANDPNKWGADSIFSLQGDKMSFASYYKLPAAQGDSENCVAHNGSLWSGSRP